MKAKISIECDNKELHILLATIIADGLKKAGMTKALVKQTAVLRSTSDRDGRMEARQTFYGPPESYTQEGQVELLLKSNPDLIGAPVLLDGILPNIEDVQTEERFFAVDDSVGS
jgi:hypothetical protein